MEIINNPKLTEMAYPVGSYLTGNSEVIELMAQYIIDMRLDEVNLWCSGSSGAIIAGIVSYKLMKQYIICNICHVKKPNEQSHCSGAIYYNHCKQSIIIDDFIASGQTVNRIYEAMRNRGIAHVDTLIVSGNVVQQSLIFEPVKVICRNYSNLK